MFKSFYLDWVNFEYNFCFINSKLLILFAQIYDTYNCSTIIVPFQPLLKISIFIIISWTNADFDKFLKILILHVST